ncbi:SHOCT domain-containing protein [Kitasatospora albolonga]|uniref:SHOCT domain-containing protein n=1 Tax=Kitasatospora albolonga TaxID=68173 RepID=UPI0031E7FC2E
MSELVARKCRACGHLQMLHESTAMVVQQNVHVAPQPYPVHQPQPPYPAQPYPVQPPPYYPHPVQPPQYPAQPPYPQQAQYPAPPPYPVPPVPPTDRAARLRELQDLRDQDLITEDEFQAQRQEIIRSI